MMQSVVGAVRRAHTARAHEFTGSRKYTITTPTRVTRRPTAGLVTMSVGSSQRQRVSPVGPQLASVSMSVGSSHWPFSHET
jgi:hypothetical protein